MHRKPSYEDLERRVAELEARVGDPERRRAIEVSGIDIAWDAESGTCTFEGLPVAMMWIDTTLSGLMSGLHAMVGTRRFGLALQSEGRKSVEEDWKVISRFPNFQEGFRAIANIAAVAGWGDWRLSSLDEEKRSCRFRVRGSWEARHQRARSVCWGSGMLAGKFAGYCTRLFGTNCWAEQTRFFARGDAFDEFVVRPSSRTVESEVDSLLTSDEATRADMAVVIERLKREAAERDRAERALRRSESRYRSLFNNNHAVMLLIDPEGGDIVDANAAAVSYYGWGLAELKAKKITDINTLSREQVFEEMERARSDLRRCFFFKHRRAGGDVRDVEVYSGPINLGGRKLLYSIVHDITERRQVEAAFQAESLRRTILMDVSPDGIAILNQDHRVVDANRRFAEMLGYTPEEALRLHTWDFEAQMTEDQIRSGFRDLSRTSVTFQTRHRRKDGSLYDAEVCAAGAMVFDEPMVLTISRDITDRKTAEEALLKSERFLAGIFDSIQDGISVLNPDLSIRHVNGVMKKWYPRKLPLEGQTCFACYQGRSAPCVSCPTLRCFESGRTERGVVPGPKGSAVQWIELFSYPLKDAATGAVTGVVEIVRDITDRRKMEEQIRQTQKMESIGSLAGGIAHDFNNILFPIIGLSEMLLDDLDPGGAAHQKIGEIFKAAQRAADLVKQILSFSRQSEHRLVPVRIQEVLQEVIKLSRSTIPSDIEIGSAIQADCGPVLADPVQIHQVAMNLMTNAYHAVEKGGGKISVALTEVVREPDASAGGGAAAGPCALLSVADSGCGIEPESMNKIFEPYYTTKEKGRGTGLGLATVFGIVSKLRGDITVFSAPGKGATFNVHLPLMDRGCEPFEGGEAGPPAPGCERILLVDDEEAIVCLLKEMLARLGYRVTAFARSVDALDTFRADPGAFDLVVTDMSMPHMTGDQLAGELIAVRPDIPVVICTGFSERIDKMRAAAIGIRGFLMKPVVKSEMARMIRNVLDHPGTSFS